MTSLFDDPVGLLQTGTIESYDASTGAVKVSLTKKSPNGSKVPVVVQAYYPLSLNNGLFIGAKPTSGSPVVISKAVGDQYFIISFLPQNKSQVPFVEDEEVLNYANDDTKISLSKKNNEILLGSVTNNILINAKNKLYTTRFNDEQHFTQAARQINGTIKRDKKLYEKFDLNSRLNNDRYDPKYKIIALDPTVTHNPTTSGINKNPAFVENREIVYEFEYASDIKDEVSEALQYGASPPTLTVYESVNRRQSKADTLSLSLVYPNYLIETVKGTVVDIFGNILDINRSPLPVGKDKITLNGTISPDKVDSYRKIRALERKSIAYHFELNARKDFGNRAASSNNIFDLFGFDAKYEDNGSTYDYGRLRSRFFIDIDKEGQFKINVPASSEVGNVPLLTRYENYSTLSNKDENNPNKLIFRADNLDILQDSFACPKITFGPEGIEYAGVPGSIEVKDGDVSSTPKDRRYNDGTQILHGTAYHDILKTCYLHQKEGLDIFSRYPIFANIENFFTLEEDIVSTKIETSGTSANAGGRSGSINFDGSIEMNVGANTADRQSLWLDTAGGIIANIGRDKRNISAAISMNGDVLFQIGGFGVVGDTRFVKQTNGVIGAALDLRVVHDGATATMIRIDNNGINIASPYAININTNSNVKFTCRHFEVEAENLVLQGRLVGKEFGGMI